VLLAVTPVPGMDTRRMLDSTAVGRGGGTAEDLRDMKVLELAKKNRALQLAVGRERDRVARVEERLAAGGGDAGGGEGGAASGAVAGSGGRAARAVKGGGGEGGGGGGGAGGGEAAPDSAMLRTQNRALAAQLQKAQHAVDLLKAEVAGCHRALAREVGPDVPLARVLAAHAVPRSGLTEGGAGGGGGGGGEGEGGGAAFAPGDWRGRAQTIATLRTRVRALERELTTAREQDDAATMYAMGGGVSGGVSGGGGGGGLLGQGADGSFFVDPATGAPLDTAFGLGMEEGGALAGGGGAAHTLAATARGGGGGGGASMRPPRALAPNVDDKAIALLNYRSEGKSTKVVALQAELSAAAAALEKARADAVGAKARNSVLEADLKKLRASTRSLLLKTETDDRLVERLRLELATNQAEKQGLAADLTAARSSQPLPNTSEAAARDAAVARATIAKLKEHVGVLRGLVEARGHVPPPLPPLPPPFDAAAAPAGGASSRGGGERSSPQRAAAHAEQQRMLEQLYLQQQEEAQRYGEYNAQVAAQSAAAQQAQQQLLLLQQQQQVLMQHKQDLEEQGIELALASGRR
jgi:hypothetical protein